MMIVKVIQGQDLSLKCETEMIANSGIALLVLGVLAIVLVAGPSLSVNANFYGKRGNQTHLHKLKGKGKGKPRFVYCLVVNIL